MGLSLICTVEDSLGGVGDHKQGRYKYTLTIQLWVLPIVISISKPPISVTKYTWKIYSVLLYHCAHNY